MAYAPSANGAVNAIITDGNTVYVGGNFTTFGGVTGFKYLARYSAVTGAVDTTWKPQLPNYNGVLSLCLSPDKQSIFVGHAGGDMLQKWSVSTGLQENFITVQWQGGGSPDGVTAMLLDGNSLYMTGNWKLVAPYGGSAVAATNGLLKIDVTGNSNTGAVDGSFTTGNIVNTTAISSDADYIYVGGAFTNVNGVTSTNIVKLNKSDGAIADDWTTGSGQHFQAAGANARVRSVLVGSDGYLYAAGVGLTSYRGTAISTSLVKLTKAGVLQSFSTPFTSTAHFNQIIEVDGQLYVTRRPVSSAGGGIYKGTDGLNSFALDASFTGSISNGNINNRVMAQYNGLNLLIGINADTGAYNGSGTARHYAISKTTGAVVELQSDTTGPTVALSSAVSSGATTGSSPVSMTATFSESVTGFVVGDVTVSGGSAGNFAGSGTTYTFDVTPSGQGLVSVSIASGVCEDAFGNTNSASSSYTFTYDTAAPTVTLSAVNAQTLAAVSSGSVIAQVALVVTASFSEPVTGLVSGDFSVAGGSASNFTDLGGGSYSLTLTPSGDGQMSISLPQGAASDEAGNESGASNSLTFTVQTPGGGGGSPVASLSAQSVVRKGIITVSIDKAAVASVSGVAQNLWRRVLMVYKATGKPDVAMSFKPSQATPSSRFRANINSAASYTLHSVIVVRTNAKSTVIPRASISSPTQYDVSVT